MNDLYRILTNPETAIRSTNHPLAKLLRHILADLQITPVMFDRLLNQYLDDPRNGVKPGDRSGRSSTRGNRIKEITKDNLTWENLMKALVILAPDMAELSLALHWPSGKITYHSISMVMNQNMEPVEHETTVNGQTVTANVPPALHSHWTGVKTGMTTAPDPHTHVNYTYGDETIGGGEEKKGDDE